VVLRNRESFGSQPVQQTRLSVHGKVFRPPDSIKDSVQAAFPDQLRIFQLDRPGGSVSGIGKGFLLVGKPFIVEGNKFVAGYINLAPHFDGVDVIDFLGDGWQRQNIGGDSLSFDAVPRVVA